MNDTGVKQLEMLMDNFWITKEQNTQDYYDIKNKLNVFKDFTQDKLGSKIIITPKLIKLEKIPVYPLPSMGIECFDSKLDYILLCLTLVFLEDKMDKEAFILSNLVEFITNNALSLNLDTLPNWNLFSNRKSLINVLNYLVSLNIIRIKDTTIRTFTEDKDSDALYEATGLANYLIREFNHEIFNYINIEDFIQDEWGEQIQEKGDVRRFKVYRNLLFTPVAYTNLLDASEVDYIRKFRGSIKSEVESATNATLEVDKSMCLLLYDYDNRSKNHFPNTKAISDIVLILNKVINEKLESQELQLDENETIFISKEQLLQILNRIKTDNSAYLSKFYQDMTLNNFNKEVIDYMKLYNFIGETEEQYCLYPMVLKMYGVLENIKIDDSEQLNIFGGNYE